MTEAGKTSPEQLYWVTLIVAGNIDIVTRRENCEIIIENLNYCSEHKNLVVYDYVLMSNRLYMIAAAAKGHVSRVLRDFKTLTARQVLKTISENAEENRKEWLMRRFHFYSKRDQHSSDRHLCQFGTNTGSLGNADVAQ